MAEFIRAWVLGLVGAGIAIAVILALTPEGAIKKIVRLGAGLVLLLVVMQPLIGLSGFNLSLGGDMSALALEHGQQVALESQLDIISERLSTYISAKAENLGLEVTATPELNVTAEGITLYSVTIRYQRGGSVTAIEELTRWIASHFGIPAQRQHWRVA